MVNSSNETKDYGTLEEKNNTSEKLNILVPQNPQRWMFPGCGFLITFSYKNQ